MIKKQTRVLGIDDGPFNFKQEKVIVIGVVMRLNGYIEGILSRYVDVDGLNSTDTLIEMINNTRHHDQIRVTMIDGIALGGFNVVDAERVYRETNIPVITITRYEPNFDLILKTLKKRFSDWEKRWGIIENNNEIVEIKTSYNPIYITLHGISRRQAEEIIRKSTIRGVIPEPLRIAHIIASGVTRGESYGKA